MGKLELMQEKIEKQRQLPEEIKDRLNTITFINLLISILLMAYLLAINIVYLNEDRDIFITCAKVFAMTLIIIDVVLFEIAYRKDMVSLWIHSFELLACSILILAIPYIYLYLDEVIKRILMLAPVFFSIYYVGKTIIIQILETKHYQNNLSDVKEILKEDYEGYLDDYDESDSDEENSENDEEDDDIKIGNEKEGNLVKDIQDIEKQKKIEKNILKRAKKELKEN